MKKRIVAIMLAALMCFGVSACGSASDAEIETEEEAEEEKDEKEEKEEKEEKPEKEEEEPEEVVEEVKYNEYQITQINTVFNNERAWVQYNEGSDKKIGLIDTEGKVIFSDLRSDGSSSCSVMDKSAYTRVKNGYVITDLDGNELFRIEKIDDCKITIIDSCNDKYLVYEESSTFDSEKKVLYLINGKGEKISEEYSTESPDDFSVHLGNNISYIYSGAYSDREQIFVNYETDEIYSNDVFGFGDGYYIPNVDTEELHDPKLYNIYPGGIYSFEGYFILEPEDYSGKEALDAWIDTSKLAKGDVIAYQFNDGFCFVASDNPKSIYRVYDSDKQLVKEYTFADGVHYMAHSYFSDGYAFIEMSGVDGKTYFSLVDTKGDMLFDPVLVPDSRSEYVALLKNGYVLFSDNIATPEGEILTIGDDLSGLSLEETIIKPHYSAYSNGEEFGVSDGFIRSAGNRNVFYSVDGKTVLDKVLVAE